MDRFEISEGTDVYGSDGDKVGSVVAVQPNYIVVEKGFFFPTDYYIPTSAVSSYDDGKVYLNVTKDQALNQGWDAEPVGDYVDAGYATTAGADVVSTDYSADATRDVEYVETAGTRTSQVLDDDSLRVQVHEEELTATKREREIGQVRVDKDVISEERILEVPVTEERVRVERRVVDRAVTDTGDVFEEGTIEVPIHGEEIQTHKEVRVAEEIEIGKEAVQRTERVADTVRREEVRITEGTTGTGTGYTSGTTGTTRGDDGGLLDDIGDAVRGENDRTR